MTTTRSNMHDVVLLSSMDTPISKTGHKAEKVNALAYASRSIGPYKLRTFLEKKGYSCKVLEYVYFYTNEQIIALFDKFITKQTKVLGLSTTYLFRRIDGSPKESYDHMIEPILKLKEKYPDLKIVLGGPDASTIDFPQADYCVDGYAENALLAIVEQNVTRTLKNRYDVDTLHALHDYPFDHDYYTLWKEEDCLSPHEVVPIEVSRGCIFKCSFCAFPLNGRKKFDYIRDVESLKEELIYNYEKFGLTRYILTDDTFNDSVQKLETLYDALRDLPFTLGFIGYIKPEMLVAKPEMIPLISALGLEHPSYGVETLHPDARKAMKKGFTGIEVMDKISELKAECLKRKNGLIFSGITNMIIGLPYEDKETLMANKEIVDNHFSTDNTTWNAMAIQDSRMRVGRNLSDIDLNPKKYHYQVGPIDMIRNLDPNKSIEGFRSSNLLYWRNPTNKMDYIEANKLTKLYFINSYLKGKISGFQVSGIRTAGIDLTKHFNEQDGDYSTLTDTQLNDAIDNVFLQRQKYYEYQMAM